MYRIIRTTTAFWAVVVLLTTKSFTQPVPPTAPVRLVVEDYFGTKITDLYRWMEDMKYPEPLTWKKAQSDYTRTKLDNIQGRREMLNRLTTLSNASPA